MEVINDCQLHKNPLELYCEKCKELICFKCIKLHRECQGMIDPQSYAEEHLVIKFKNQIEDFDNNSKVMIESFKSFFVMVNDILKELIQLRDKMSVLLSQINESIETFKRSDPSSINFDNTREKLAQKYQDLLAAIKNEDRKTLIINIKNQDKDNIPEMGDSHKILIDIIKESTSFFLKSKEFDNLNDSLKEFIKKCKMISSQPVFDYLRPINSRYIYNLCSPNNSCKTLARYDIETKKNSNLITVNPYSTITQINNRIYLSGGRDPYTNALNEYLESSQTLTTKSPMIYNKVWHAIEVISDDKFVVTGGYNDVSLNYCEEYSLKKNKWYSFPSLNTARNTHTTAFVEKKFLYAIGGWSSGNSIEMIDISKKDCWNTVNILSRDLEFDANPEAFSISDNEIIIITGNSTTDYGIFNIADKTIKKSSNKIK